jgi:hypothetical protein
MHRKSNGVRIEGRKLVRFWKPGKVCVSKDKHTRSLMILGDDMFWIGSVLYLACLLYIIFSLFLYHNRSIGFVFSLLIIYTIFSLFIYHNGSIGL